MKMRKLTAGERMIASARQALSFAEGMPITDVRLMFRTIST